MTRTELINALRTIRTYRVCCYMPPHNERMCDCKYGVTEKSTRSQTSEQTGCCELREAIFTFERMKDEEFDDISTRTPEFLAQLAKEDSKS